MPDDDGKFQRWQAVSIAQFGYAQNLILAFAVAALGFSFSLLRDRAFVPTSSAKCNFIISLLINGLSTLSGLACVLNRLHDFRMTAQRARGNAQALSKQEVAVIGDRTWILFYIQIVSSLVGILLLAVTILLTDGGKLR
jgi:hypothetical protein